MRCIQGFLLMRLGTILSGLDSGTAVAAKARKGSALAFTHLFCPSGGQYSSVFLRSVASQASQHYY